MQDKDFKKWLLIYLVMHRKKQPTMELQYKLSLEIFLLYCKEKSSGTREENQAFFEEALEAHAQMFQRNLPQNIKDEIDDWKTFAIGYISNELWEKLKDYYEKTYNEKFDVKKVGTL